MCSWDHFEKSFFCKYFTKCQREQDVFWEHSNNSFFAHIAENINIQEVLSFKKLVLAYHIRHKISTFQESLLRSEISTFRGKRCFPEIILKNSFFANRERTFFWEHSKNSFFAHIFENINIQEDLSLKKMVLAYKSKNINISRKGRYIEFTFSLDLFEKIAFRPYIYIRYF